MSIAGAAGVAGALSMGGTASAAVSTCALPEAKTAFAQFGDTSLYFLATGADFEGSLSWGHTGAAALVAGNEPFKLSAATDDQSLRLGPGGVVTMPKMCVTADTPHLRFVAKAVGAGPLEVEVKSFGPDGGAEGSSFTTVSPSDHAVWAPSREVGLRTDALLTGAVGSVIVKFRSQGDWQMDDVFVDPFAR